MVDEDVAVAVAAVDSAASRLREVDRCFFGGRGIGAGAAGGRLLVVLPFWWGAIAAAEMLDVMGPLPAVRLTTSTPPPQQAHSYNSVTEYMSLVMLVLVTPPPPPRFNDR